MKNIITTVIGCLFAASFTYAQCDKKVVLKASKTEYLDADSVLQRSVEEPSEIVIDKKDITILAGSPDKKMTGAIKSYTCNFTEPFKEGKMVFTTSISNDQGEGRDVTVTVESKGGKTVFLVSVVGQNRIIRLYPDLFEEAH